MSESLAAQLCLGGLDAAAQALRAGRVTSVALTRAALQRAAAAEERCHGFLEIESEAALERAAALDVELDRVAVLHERERTARRRLGIPSLGEVG